MADILTNVFSTYMPKDVKNEFHWASSQLPTCSTLVVGDRTVNRSLLLLAAITAASETGRKVVFFTQNQIQSLPVTLQSCLPNLSPESLKKIKFSYPSTVEELLMQVACLHESTNTSPTTPSLIIVDRLEGYLRGPGGSQSAFHQGEQSCAAHVSALLHDTASFLTQVLERQNPGLAPCRVIASFQSQVEVGQAAREHSVPDPLHAVLDRYFPVRCTLDRNTSYGATAAGSQEVWHVYFSGTGITETTCAHNSKDKQPGIAQEWQLVIFPNGPMEFTVV